MMMSSKSKFSGSDSNEACRGKSARARFELGRVLGSRWDEKARGRGVFLWPFPLNFKQVFRWFVMVTFCNLILYATSDASEDHDDDAFFRCRS